MDLHFFGGFGRKDTFSKELKSSRTRKMRKLREDQIYQSLTERFSCWSSAQDEARQTSMNGSLALVLHKRLHCRLQRLVCRCRYGKIKQKKRCAGSLLLSAGCAASPYQTKKAQRRTARPWFHGLRACDPSVSAL